MLHCETRSAQEEKIEIGQVFEDDYLPPELGLEPPCPLGPLTPGLLLLSCFFERKMPNEAPSAILTRMHSKKKVQSSLGEQNPFLSEPAYAGGAEAGFGSKATEAVPSRW
jgi:hypothetical protein